VVAGYTYGSDPLAVERLELVARAYEPVSRRFLADHAAVRPGVALDLGCGPGFSTQLIADVCTPADLVGVDSSDEFLAVARAAVPGARFLLGDVTAEPLPGAPADLVYARLVLAHLPDPLATADAWRACLRPGGRVLIEDLEGIDAPAGPLRSYDDLAAAIVRAGGGLMYAGSVLAALGGRTTAVTVPAAVAARIYHFNVRRWRAAPPVGVAVEELDDLHAGLAAVAAADGSATLSWIVRQLALAA
jgi:trans-aconitate 2-methyltransferase